MEAGNTCGLELMSTVTIGLPVRARRRRAVEQGVLATEQFERGGGAGSPTSWTTSPTTATIRSDWRALATASSIIADRRRRNADFGRGWPSG